MQFGTLKTCGEQICAMTWWVTKQPLTSCATQYSRVRTLQFCHGDGRTGLEPLPAHIAPSSYHLCTSPGLQCWSSSYITHVLYSYERSYKLTSRPSYTLAVQSLVLKYFFSSDTAKRTCSFSYLLLYIPRPAASFLTHFPARHQHVDEISPCLLRRTMPDFLLPDTRGCYLS